MTWRTACLCLPRVSANAEYQYRKHGGLILMYNYTVISELTEENFLNSKLKYFFTFYFTHCYTKYGPVWPKLRGSITLRLLPVTYCLLFAVGLYCVLIYDLRNDAVNSVHCVVSKILICRICEGICHKVLRKTVKNSVILPDLQAADLKTGCLEH
jgi:hypothetical protein